MINLPSMKRFLTICVGLLSVATFGQALPYTSITNIQYVSATDLANCNDTSAYLGDTVMTYGIVVTPGDRSEVASGSVQGGHRPFLFIVDTVAQGAAGAWRGMEVMGVYTNAQGQLLPIPNIEYLIPGDLVKVVGRVGVYNNGNQLETIDANSIQVMGSRPLPTQLKSR